MAGTVAGTIAVGYLRRLRPRAAPASAPGAAPGQARRPWWKPTWSVPAALRALRATIVVPALFALSLEGIGKPQMALFASFGGFATLVFASFGGTRKDKLLAHLGLAVVGSVGLTIGTLVSGTAWIAAVVTVPVAFAIFFAGVIGPNAASGVTAALLGYVLPVASVGGVATIPDRLAGWWLASAVGTAAVLLTSPPSEGGRLRAAAGRMAAELANSMHRGARGQVTDREATTAAGRSLAAAFNAAPYRPTGLATVDQALTNLGELLVWCASLAGDAFDGHLDLTRTAPADRELLAAAARAMGDIATLLAGRPAAPDLAGLELARDASAAHMRELSADDTGTTDGDAGPGITAALAVHAQKLAVATRDAVQDALIVSGRASPATVAAERRQWYGATGSVSARAAADGTAPGNPAERRLAGLADAMRLVSTHASIRSVWLLNSTRGTAALAVAVAVADLSGLQHGFWVVLGTLSVLRTNAASTGATALRALAGAAVGFIVGAVLLLGIGTSQTSLWIALPVAVLIASYAPGTSPFAVGQAAFTVFVVVLFNLLVPVGWKVGVLRVEDVALGCAVSLVVGVLFWPRGAGSVVTDDLADAFRTGGAYLRQAVDWALGDRMVAPDAGTAAVTAGIRLDDALRGYLAEQGSKRMGREDVSGLVLATMRLRLTAHALASLHRTPAHTVPNARGVLPAHHDDPVHAALRNAAAGLISFYDQVATSLTRQGGPVPGAPPALLPDELALELVAGRPHQIWVRVCLYHLRDNAEAIFGPAGRMARLRHTPWWR